VLFVHGIGQQRQGETLTAWGDAIILWLRRWIDGGAVTVASQKADAGVSQDGSVTITMHEAVVDGQALDSTTPAYLMLTVETKSTSPVIESKWLMAEAWWADAFLPATFHDLSVWGLQVVPWTLFMHFGIRIRRASDNIDRRLHTEKLNLTSPEGFTLFLVSVVSKVLIAAVYMLCALVTIVIALLVVVLLLLLALLPIPWMREIVLRLQVLIAAFLGDSYVLLISPVRSTAIVTRVQRAFDWVAAQCRTGPSWHTLKVQRSHTWRFAAASHPNSANIRSC
jgi:hypothetical protein